MNCRKDYIVSRQGRYLINCVNCDDDRSPVYTLTNRYELPDCIDLNSKLKIIDIPENCLKHDQKYSMNLEISLIESGNYEHVHSDTDSDYEMFHLAKKSGIPEVRRVTSSDELNLQTVAKPHSGFCDLLSNDDEEQENFSVTDANDCSNFTPKHGEFEQVLELSYLTFYEKHQGRTKLTSNLVGKSANINGTFLDIDRTKSKQAIENVEDITSCECYCRQKSCTTLRFDTTTKICHLFDLSVPSIGFLNNAKNLTKEVKPFFSKMGKSKKKAGDSMIKNMYIRHRFHKPIVQIIDKIGFECANWTTINKGSTKSLLEEDVVFMYQLRKSVVETGEHGALDEEFILTNNLIKKRPKFGLINFAKSTKVSDLSLTSLGVHIFKFLICDEKTGACSESREMLIKVFETDIDTQLSEVDELHNKKEILKSSSVKASLPIITKAVDLPINQETRSELAEIISDKIIAGAENSESKIEKFSNFKMVEDLTKKDLDLMTAKKLTKVVVSGRRDGREVKKNVEGQGPLEAEDEVDTNPVYMTDEMPDTMISILKNTGGAAISKKDIKTMQTINLESVDQKIGRQDMQDRTWYEQNYYDRLRYPFGFLAWSTKKFTREFFVTLNNFQA